VPNKTIYVSEEDLPLLERAQRLAGGNLSSAVVRALARSVEAQEAQAQGFEEVTLRVGRAGSRRRKRFLGRRVAQWRRGSGEDGVEVFTAFRTPKGRYVVHRKRLPGASYWSDPLTWYESSDSESWWGAHDWWDPGEYSLDVYETFAELEQQVPDELARLVEEGERESPLEELDI
jgi:EXLDI family protein